MRVQVGTLTAGSLLFAGFLSFLMATVLAQLSLSLAVGVGMSLAVLIIAGASNELALYLLIFSMLLGPEVIVATLGTGGSIGRDLTFRLDDLVLAVVGLTWLGKTALYKELGLVFRTPLNRQIAAYSFAAFFATGLGMITGRVAVLSGALFIVKYFQYFVIYFMVVNNLRERKQVERFVFVLLSTAATASLIGIYQIPSGGRVSAPFEGARGEPNTFGGYLILMLALAAGLYLTSRSVRQKLLLACLVALMTLPLLFTLSRASYLALLPLAGALFIWSDRKRLLASLFAVGLAFLPVLTPKAVVDRTLFTITQPAQRDQMQVGGFRLDTSTSARLRDWHRAVFEDWKTQPLFGYGVTGYRFIDAQYPRVLVETGLLGLAAFLWLQVGLFRQARATLRTSQDPLFKGIALGFLSGFIALVAHSIGANTFIIVRIMEPFWFLAGMVVMIPELERPSGAPAARVEAQDLRR